MQIVLLVHVLLALAARRQPRDRPPQEVTTAANPGPCGPPPLPSGLEPPAEVDPTIGLSLSRTTIGRSLQAPAEAADVTVLGANIAVRGRSTYVTRQRAEAVWWFYLALLADRSSREVAPHASPRPTALQYTRAERPAKAKARRRRRSRPVTVTMGEEGEDPAASLCARPSLPFCPHARQHRVYSILFELRDNRDSHRLVKGAHHAEAALVRVPIEGADRLRGQVLLVQQLEVPGHALRDAVGVLD